MVTDRPPCRQRARTDGPGRLARPGRGARPGRLRRPGACSRPAGRRRGRRGGGLAGGAGLVGAVGAYLGAVAHVVGGDIQRDQHGLPVAGRDDDRGTAVWAGRLGCRLRGWRLVDGGPVRVVLGAFVDACQVADEEDGAAGVLVVAVGEPVPVQYVQDVGEQVESYPVVSHAPFLRWWWRAGGWMSGAVPVPVAGFHPYWGG